MAKYYTNIVSYIFLFGVLKVADSIFVLFHSSSDKHGRKLLLNHSESIGFDRKCMCLSIFFMSLWKYRLFVSLNALMLTLDATLNRVLLDPTHERPKQITR